MTGVALPDGKYVEGRLGGRRSGEKDGDKRHEAEVCCGGKCFRFSLR